jgi:lipopolysaccharide export system protein LptC
MNSSLVLVPPRTEAVGARERAFAAARRHSRRVRAMRRGLELAVVLGGVAIAALALYRNFGRALSGATFEGVGFEGGRITMDKPHLTGARPGGGGYDITAVKAMQDPRRPGDVDLALIGGEIVTPDHESSRLTAGAGHYDGANETLDLSDDVRLANSRYRIFLHSVRIAFKSGDYVSQEPIKAQILPDATITADTFKARNGGAEATFEGHVRTLIHGKDAAPERATP